MFLNSQAFGMALLRHWIFKWIFCKILPTQTLRNVYTRFQNFYSFCTLQILHGIPLGREKKDFSKDDLGISPKTRIQAAVKNLKWGWNSLKTLCYVEGSLHDILWLSNWTLSDTPSNFIFTIFSKVYHTLGHTSTSLVALKNKPRPPEAPLGILNNPGVTAK